MKFEARWVFALLFLAGFGSPSGAAPGRPEEAWLEELAAGHQLSALQMQEVRRVVAGSSRLGQGNKAVTTHPMSGAECRQRRAAAAKPGEAEQAREHAAICGAPHMAPLYDPEQMASRGSALLGFTEMKGSWFVFDRYRAHEDACRWRAPFWHGSRVLDPASHRNYHLGFRCCKSLAIGVTSEPKVPVAPSGARPAAPSGGGRF